MQFVRGINQMKHCGALHHATYLCFVCWLCFQEIIDRDPTHFCLAGSEKRVNQRELGLPERDQDQT